MKAGKVFNVEVRFVNPLPISLTSVVLYVEGPGLVRQAKVQSGVSIYHQVVYIGVSRGVAGALPLRSRFFILIHNFY